MIEYLISKNTKNMKLKGKLIDSGYKRIIKKV